MIVRQCDDLDLAFSLVADCTQPVGFLRLAGQFGIHQEQKAARNIHGLNNESHGNVRQPLHVEDVADLFAVGMQGAAGMELPNIQPKVHPTPYQ